VYLYKIKYFERMILFLVVITTTFVILCDSDATAQKKDFSGRLVYGDISFPPTFDPVTNNHRLAIEVSDILFSGLISLNLEYTKVVPQIAENWFISPDGLTYIFYLRNDVFWHDGKPLVADDVIYTYNLIMHPKTISPLKSSLFFVKSVKKIGKYTVQFTLGEPLIERIALGRLGFKILPKHLIGLDYLTLKNRKFLNTLTGTGPFMFVKKDYSQKAEFVANKKYFEPEKPKLEKIILTKHGDLDVLLQALQFGSVDLVSNIPPQKIIEIEKVRDLTVRPKSHLTWYYVAFNFNNPMLAVKEFRQAIVHAINREEMLKAHFNGHGKIITGPFAHGSWAYNMDVKQRLFDINRSNTILDSLGYFDTNGDGFREDRLGNNVKLVMKIPVSSVSSGSVGNRVAVDLQGRLRKIGIDLKLEYREMLSWKEEVFKNKDFDLVYSAWNFADDNNIFSLFSSTTMGQWQNNFISYSNPNVDNLLEEARKSKDVARLQIYYLKLHEILNNDSPYVFMWSITTYTALRNEFNAYLDPFRVFAFSADWYKR